MENKGSDEVEKLKTKFLSVWHNVKYSWALKSKTSFSRNSPVLLLGKCYHFKAEDEDSPTEEACCEATDEDFVMGNVEAFRRDFASRVWLTYREEFPPLPGSTLTSDCGWGCMLRAGQMMLAQALVLHLLGRDWTWSEALTLQPLDTETWTTSAAKRLVASLEASLQGSHGSSHLNSPEKSTAQDLGSAQEADAHLKDMYHQTLVSWFGDSPSAQLGIHRLVRLGLTMGKQAGDWYGPAVVAHILKKAVEEAIDPVLARITAYVSQDCTVYSADVMDCHRAHGAGQDSGAPPPHDEPSTPDPPEGRTVIIFIPVRLGGERTNPEYINFVKNILSLDYCLGIIGGKPKQACYIVGFQECGCENASDYVDFNPPCWILKSNNLLGDIFDAQKPNTDDSLIYMDPHYCQSFVDVSTSDFPLQSYHCPSPKKMPFSKMDPSCTIGFYSRSIQDFERISLELTKVLQPSAKEKYPVFTIVQGHSRDYDLSTSLTPEKREWPFIRRTVTTTGDFVLL